MKTSDQITDEVSEAMVAEYQLHREQGESARTALAWELVSGDTLVVEHALDDLVRRAIEADRAQRLTFTDPELNLIEAVLKYCDDGRIMAGAGKTTLRNKIARARERGIS